MKFGQLIEYNISDIFLEKSYKKYCGDAIPRAFSRKSKLNISVDQQCKVLYKLFLSTKVQTTCFYLIYSSLKNTKTKGHLKVVSVLHLLHHF